LPVPGRIDAQRAEAARGDVLDRDEIDGSELRAEDCEVVDLAGVVATRAFRIAMVAITAAGREADCAVAKPTGLALDAPEP
jgi:hypothetical protein